MRRFLNVCAYEQEERMHYLMTKWEKRQQGKKIRSSINQLEMIIPFLET